MSIGWNGQDPVQSGDSDDYELGTEYIANVDVTLTKIRVWADATEEGFVGRIGTIWSTAGAVLGTAVLADTLPAGWSSYNLAAPIERLAGERWVVTYPSGGRWGQRSNALEGSVPSANGAVTALASSLSTNGNGIFNSTPGLFPTSTFNESFYGIDIEFDVGVASGGAPTIVSVALAADGLTVTATVTATDPDTLTNAVYLIEWGDGDTSSGTHPTISYQHTYATEGLKSILVRVTDATLRTDYASAAIVLFSPATFDPTAIVGVLASHAAASGYFDRVNGHEPKNSPGQGLTCAIWLQAIGPARAASGLRATSGRAVMFVRIYANMTQEPQDEIDPMMMDATSALIAAYSGDFELGGNVRNVDLLGAHGEPLGALAGYINVSGTLYRAMTITVPLIINDLWPQAR